MAEIVQSNPLNNPTEKEVKTRSHLNLRQIKGITPRFGLYAPHMVFEVVPDDKRFSFQSAHDAESYTLRAPLMQDISLKKDYFMVDRRAILPMNYDKVYTAPKVGDDVDAQEVGTSVKKFLEQASSIVSSFFAVLGQASGTANLAAWLEAFIRAFLVGEYFYSNGSLIAHLGSNLSPCIRVVPVSATGNQFRKYSFDQLEDYFFGDIVRRMGNSDSSFSARVGERNFQVYNALPSDLADNSQTNITFAQFLDLCRDSMDFQISYIAPAFANLLGQMQSLFGTFSFGYSTSEYPLDLGRAFAYQIVCHHFYTNDNVDYVYNAETYRQVYNYWRDQVDSLSDDKFTLNGIQYDYDYLSAHRFTRAIDTLYNELHNADVTSDFYRSYITACSTWLRMIFGFNRSLRFMDYFVGSRTRPLAVGDTNVEVRDNRVSVLDVTQRIQMQRALNAVNRLFSRQLPDWVKGIFGVDTPRPDFHDPSFLARTEDKVYTTEVENTSTQQINSQQSVTARFTSNASKYAFEVEQVDYPSIVIGITSFDIERMYPYFVERQLLAVDRYDMFNPFLQYIGDQPIYSTEINPRQAMTAYFGYTLRHMEYKQMFNEAIGGFVENLPGYAFLGNDLRDVFGWEQAELDPDFIRSYPFELDDFYVSLTGFSLASRFHFIIKNTNMVDISRPMAFAPTIL